MLYAIFKACSFEDICDEIRDKKDAEKEKIVAARLKERLTQFYETKVQG
jgi:DNA-directed RNA polymerase delta subunit